LEGALFFNGFEKIFYGIKIDLFVLVKGIVMELLFKLVVCNKCTFREVKILFFEGHWWDSIRLTQSK
jgi:hypothetical protein